MMKMFLQRVILVMLLVATSLVSFARFDSGYGHPDHAIQSDHYSNHTQQAPSDLLAEGVEEGFEEEVESSDFIQTTCFCKNASRWVDYSETRYINVVDVRPASERCVILSVFRL